MEAEMETFRKGLEACNNFQEISRFLESQGLDHDEIMEVLPELRDSLKQPLDNEIYDEYAMGLEKRNDTQPDDKELNRYIQDAWKIFSQVEDKSDSSIISDVDDHRWQISGDVVWSILEPAIKDKGKVEFHLAELLNPKTDGRGQIQKQAAEDTVKKKGPYLVSGDYSSSLQLEPVERHRHKR